MSTITAEYVPQDPPMDLGYEATYSGTMVRRFLYGAVKVTFPDGVKIYQPHTAIQGTISAEPLDLDATDFGGTSRREMAIEAAERTRATQ